MKKILSALLLGVALLPSVSLSTKTPKKNEIIIPQKIKIVEDYWNLTFLKEKFREEKVRLEDLAKEELDREKEKGYPDPILAKISKKMKIRDYVKMSSGISILIDQIDKILNLLEEKTKTPEKKYTKIKKFLEAEAKKLEQYIKSWEEQIEINLSRKKNKSGYKLDLLEGAIRSDKLTKKQMKFRLKEIKKLLEILG